MNTFHSQEEFELIEQYLMGLPDPEIQEEIRLKILSDADFAARVEEISQLRLGVERAALAAKLNSFHADVADQNRIASVRRLNPFQLWGVAASFFLIISAGIWWIIGQRSPGEDLYQTYYQADPGLVTSMSGDSNYDFERAMVDYKSGEYPKAKAAFESLLKNGSQNDTLRYFLAMTELNLQNEPAAKQLLQAVSMDSTSGFSKDSFWYLALLAMKEGEFDLAKKYLEQSGRTKSDELIQAMEDVSRK